MAEIVGPTGAHLGNMNYNYYVTLVSITILVYDFFLTFPMEVERFWFVSRVNFAIFLFYINRYLIILGYIPILIENFWVTDDPAKKQICRSLQTYHECLSTVVQLIVAVLLIMRTYALYKRDIRVLVVFVSISIILFAGGSWAGYGGYTSPVDQDVLVHVGCGVLYSSDRAKRFALSWASMFLFDILVFGMTLYRIIGLRRSNTASVLTTVFMRDGAMYFGITATCALVNILSLLLGQPLTRDVGVTFTNVISSVVMSRLMLNLRDPSLIAVPGRDLSDDTSYPNLTFVESRYLSELSSTRSGGRGAEYRSHPNDQALETQEPPGDDIELGRIGA